MRRNYGYGSYRGKSAFRTFLKIVAAALALVLILLVGAFFFLQQYVVYSADGVRLELPFLTERDAPPTPSQVIIVETPAPVIVTPEPTPTPAPSYTRMAALPSDLLVDDEVRNLSERDGGEGLKAYPGAFGATQFIFSMKGYDGKLGYISDIPLAKEVKSSGADPARQEGILAANGGNGNGLYNAAYLSCFQDNTAPYNKNRLALRTSIGNWRGPGDIRWMTPQSEEARQYLTDICVELCGLGFTDLILDYAAFPKDGNLNLILKGDRYDPASFAETVTGFYRQVREALDGTQKREQTPFRLGIVTDKTTLRDGVNPTSGQTLDALLQYADRIYADLEGEDPAAYLALLRDRGVEQPEEYLVVLLEAPPLGDAPYSWAILPE